MRVVSRQCSIVSVALSAMLFALCMSAEAQQFSMCTLFDDFAVFKYKNLIGMGEGT